MLFSASCASIERARDEFTFADAAIKHAKRHQADRFAPELFRRAEREFLKGKSWYADEDFAKARESFLLATKFAKMSMRKAFIVKETDVEPGF